MPYALRRGSMHVPLNERQGRIILALFSRPYLTREDMVEIAWPNVEAQPDYWIPILCGLIWRTNKKLAPFRLSGRLAAGYLPAYGNGT